jgi:hypothetical protein
MNIQDSFNDPRHRRSEELSFLAERTERAGDRGGALAQVADAARLEEEHALAVPGEVPEIRELFAVSAVALWLRAEQWAEAARAGGAFLARPNMLTPDGVRAIEELVAQARREAEVAREPEP